MDSFIARHLAKTSISSIIVLPNCTDNLLSAHGSGNTPALKWVAAGSAKNEEQRPICCYCGCALYVIMATFEREIISLFTYAEMENSMANSVMVSRLVIKTLLGLELTSAG
jgi:hypothetical protein